MTTIVTREPVASIGAESNASAVSWSAIAGGAVVSAGLTLFLLELGTGLGLSAVSPWSTSTAPTSRIGIGVGISIVLIAVMASGLGGYLAGRLRTKWAVRTDEAYARDLAHGLMTWAFATVISAAVLASAATAIVTGVASGASSNPGLVPDRNSYYVDTLFRSNRPAAGGEDQAARTAEAGRILTRSLSAGGITTNDRAYLGQVIAARTGISQQEAETRVDATIAQAKAAAEEARKAARNMAFWMAAALLAGALTSCFAAACGGRERDEV